MTVSPVKALVTCAALLGLTACNRQVGSQLNGDGFGQATRTDIGIQSGQLTYAVDLSKRFAREVPNTVHFAFDSAYLDGKAQRILARQADWIRQFPEVRFRVFGYTDEVGSEAYNKGLGMRRAVAVVNFLASEGIARSRLQAVVSYGKTRPLIDVPTRERKNRRAVTDVSGFVKSAPLVMDGKYADIVYRSYVASAKPQSTTQGGAGGGSSSSASGTKLK